MTDTTYYTPEENELRIGLKCEIQHVRLGNWSNYVIKDFDDFAEALVRLQEGRLRVRHLSHEDIVGCGWAQVSNSLNVSVSKYSYTTDNPRIFFELLAERTVITIFKLGTENENCVFDGSILNKSELLFFMARLNIST